MAITRNARRRAHRAAEDAVGRGLRRIGSAVDEPRGCAADRTAGRVLTSKTPWLATRSATSSSASWPPWRPGSSSRSCASRTRRRSASGWLLRLHTARRRHHRRSRGAGHRPRELPDCDDRLDRVHHRVAAARGLRGATARVRQSGERESARDDHQPARGRRAAGDPRGPAGHPERDGDPDHPRGEWWSAKGLKAPELSADEGPTR